MKKMSSSVKETIASFKSNNSKRDEVLSYIQRKTLILTVILGIALLCQPAFVLDNSLENYNAPCIEVASAALIEPPPTVASAWAYTPPTIDGFLSDNEWDDAAKVMFTLLTPELHDCSLYAKNDARNIYLLVVIEDEEYNPFPPGGGPCDSLSIKFDNDNDGVRWTVGDDDLFIRGDAGFIYDGFYRSDGGWGPDTSNGGTSDIVGAVRHTNPSGVGTYSFEFSHPLDTADDTHDFSLSPGDVVGFQLHYGDGASPGTYSAWWPSESFGNLILAEEEPGECNPELSIPIYAPKMQEAPKGTELTYIIKVTNKGNKQDTINLFVSKQSVSEWWDLQFEKSSVTLDSEESEDIFLKVVIPKNLPLPVLLNIITIKGESPNSFDEVTIIATNIDPDSILFGIIFYFQKVDSGHILTFEIPDFAEMRDNQITSSVSVVFNPKNPDDLDNAYITITDTVDGEETSPPVTLPINFNRHSNEVITSGFDMQKDAYSFSNSDFEDGKCCGMSATSILYDIDKLLLPLPPYHLDKKDAIPYIDEYQDSWLYNKLRAALAECSNNKMEEKEYKELKESIKDGEPMLFFLGGKGWGMSHTVVAYRIIEDKINNAAYILVYDPNYPYKKEGFYKAFPYITLYRNSGTFISYDGYNKFKKAEALPWYKQIKIWSPASLRVYDSQGRVTGLVNNGVRNEIPNSMYEEENKIITIFFPYDSYRYEVVGTEEGAYGLSITSVEDGETNTFTATDIPTTLGAIHQYTVDWDALSQSEKGVTVLIDSDGDGIFEQTVTTDDTFQLPIASFTHSPENPVVDETITFDASISYDPDGIITKYEWDFGDGNIIDTTEPIITHSYTSTGDYTVNLIVTDDDESKSSDSLTITVTYNIEWLPPITNQEYFQLKKGSTLPIKFLATNCHNDFVSNTTVKVEIISTTEDENRIIWQTFVYGEGDDSVRIDASESSQQIYICNLHTRELGMPLGDYTIEVSFNGVFCDSIGFDLVEPGAENDKRPK
jgi:hypothetical protein